MDDPEFAGVLEFLRSAEQLKNTHRTAWTSDGQPESVAAHCWRLCLMAIVLGDEFVELDVGRLLKICVVHDLGEAVGGDISAVMQDPAAPKAEAERRDLLSLLAPLPPAKRAEVLTLWDEYEAASSLEAKVAKALDKLETIMQHNQGANPADFDYVFNLTYGQQHTSGHPLIRRIRTALDAETAERARGGPATDPAARVPG